LHQDEECNAYILIKVDSGKDLQVFNKIRELQHTYPISEVATLYGDYDVLVKVKMERCGDLESFVYKGIRPIQGIAETQTLISAKSVEFGSR